MCLLLSVYTKIKWSNKDESKTGNNMNVKSRNKMFNIISFQIYRKR